jgi:hypothetical protein
MIQQWTTRISLNFNAEIGNVTKVFKLRIANESLQIAEIFRDEKFQSASLLRIAENYLCQSTKFPFFNGVITAGTRLQQLLQALSIGQHEVDLSLPRQHRRSA